MNSKCVSCGDLVCRQTSQLGGCDKSKRAGEGKEGT
jgi:hypothetical protein